jgi:hypothetical protein
MLYLILLVIIFPYFSLFFYIFSIIFSLFYRFYLISPSIFPRSIRFSHAYVIPLCFIFLYIYCYLFYFLHALWHWAPPLHHLHTYNRAQARRVLRAFSLDSFLPRCVPLLYLLFYVINFGFFLA